MDRKDKRLALRQTIGPLTDQLLNILLALYDAIQPAHARVVDPQSRAVYMASIGEIYDPDAIDSGKGFPGTEAGYVDPVGYNDVWSGAPPADGRICSAGHNDTRAKLDDPNRNWPKKPVSSGETLTITWRFKMKHKARRFTYWLTKEGWDSSQPLAREHLDLTPVHEVVNDYVPYYGPEAEEKLMVSDPTVHEFQLPPREAGHHVLLAVWNVADTPAAFYQAIDLIYQ